MYNCAALEMVVTSDLIFASFALLEAFKNCGIANDAKIAIMATTTISSTNVKPPCERCFLFSSR